MFNVGDKVVYTSDWDDVMSVLRATGYYDEDDPEDFGPDIGGCKELLGKIGVVVSVDGSDECPIAVDFGFRFENSHNLNGRIATHTGFWVNEAIIRPMNYKVMSYEEML